MTSEIKEVNLISTLLFCPLFYVVLGITCFHTSIDGHVFVISIFSVKGQKTLVMHAYDAVLGKLKQEDKEHKARPWATYKDCLQSQPTNLWINQLTK